MLLSTFLLLRVIHYISVINKWICGLSFSLQWLWHINAIADCCTYITGYHPCGQDLRGSIDHLPFLFSAGQEPPDQPKVRMGVCPATWAHVARHMGPCSLAQQHCQTIRWLRGRPLCSSEPERGGGPYWTFEFGTGINGAGVRRRTQLNSQP